LYDLSSQRRKSLINQLSDQLSTTTAKPNIYAKKVLMKVEGELIYTLNRWSILLYNIKYCTILL